MTEDHRTTAPTTTRRGRVIAIALAGAGLLLLTGTGAALATTATASLSEAPTPAATAPAAEVDASVEAPAADPASVESTPTDSTFDTATGAAPAAAAAASEDESSDPLGTRSATIRHSFRGVPIPGPGTAEPIYTIEVDPASIPVPDEADPTQRLDAQLWTEQRYIAGRCMADLGFPYFWTYLSGSWETRDEAGVWTDSGDEAALALWGTNHLETGPYDWTKAGCEGYAVHVMGLDDAH